MCDANVKKTQGQVVGDAQQRNHGGREGAHDAAATQPAAQVAVLTGIDGRHNGRSMRLSTGSRACHALPAPLRVHTYTARPGMEGNP